MLIILFWLKKLRRILKLLSLKLVVESELLSKLAHTKLCLSLHNNGDNSYLFVNGKEIFKLKADNKNVNFPTQFCLGSILEMSLKGNVYDFSVITMSLINLTD